MFFFNKKKTKKYVSCDIIEHGMDFFEESINFCCRIPPTKDGFKKVIPNYHGELIDWKIYFKEKRKYRKMMQKGKILPECKGCVYLQEKEWDNEDYVSHINFNNWNICNEHCIYCILNDEGMRKPKQYNVFPVIKDLYQKGYLRPTGNITIAGGEPCFSKEFSDLIAFFSDNGFGPVRVLSNATVYSDALYNAIKTGRFYMDVSVDSGTRETFIKIKRKDFYDQVWDNLAKYASVQPTYDNVKTKYIFIPGFNDTKDEIDAFIFKTVQSGIKGIVLDIELLYYTRFKGVLPQNTIDIFKYAVGSAKENNLHVKFLDRGVLVAKKLGLM